MGPLTLTPLGHLRSDFSQKFGTPRQPGLIQQAKSQLLLPSSLAGSTDGLEAFSHVWLLFWFHLNRDRQVRTKVRPPRLGGNQKIGVFSTRSPYRPNPLGLSVVSLERIQPLPSGETLLTFGGADLVDGTPIIDLKPYLPYADCLSEATSGWVAGSLPKRSLEFTPAALEDCERLEDEREGLRALIIETLQRDPRPAYHQQRSSKPNYTVRLRGVDVRWTVEGEHFIIESLTDTEA